MFLPGIKLAKGAVVKSKVGSDLETPAVSGGERREGEKDFYERALRPEDTC